MNYLIADNEEEAQRVIGKALENNIPVFEGVEKDYNQGRAILSADNGFHLIWGYDCLIRTHHSRYERKSFEDFLKQMKEERIKSVLEFIRKHPLDIVREAMLAYEGADVIASYKQGSNGEDSLSNAFISDEAYDNRGGGRLFTEAVWAWNQHEESIRGQEWDSDSETI